MILEAHEERIVREALVDAIRVGVAEERQRFGGRGESAELSARRRVLRDRCGIDMKGPCE